VRETVDFIEQRIDEYEAMLEHNTFFHVRTQGVGVISRELAQDVGVSGPLIRGSGVNYDVRRAEPYSSYGDFDFVVPVETEGDCYARYRVRMVEFRQSIRIIRQALDGLPAGPISSPPGARAALGAFIVLNTIILLVTYATLLERKFAARMQSRIGPYYVGRPHGWLQPIADALKLMLKEDVVPAAADRGVYNLAPVVFLVPCMLIFATIPFAPELGADTRVPFDILEAESELVAGFRVEYSGMKFALIQLGEYAHMLGTSFLGALLFLGGWLGPGPAWLGPLWFLAKAVLIFLVVTWVRWSFVRIRVDQILGISWKLLLPATLLLLMATGFVVALRGAGGA